MMMKQLVKGAFSKLGYVLSVHVVMLLLCGLFVCLSSCEKEVPGQGSGSGNIELKFVLSNSAYDEEGSAARNYSGSVPEPETVVVPVGDDIYMYATLEADPSDRLRASETIQPGTLVMIAAYDPGNNNNYVSSAEYQVTSGGTIVPTNNTTGRGLEIAATGSYTFVAYSIRSDASVPAHPSSPPYSIAVSPTNDVLWGSKSETINAGSNTIIIPMQHKFSLVKVSVTAASNITTLTGVSMSPVYSSATMLLSDGTLGNPGNSESQSFSFSNLDNTTVTSTDSHLVYTAGQAFSLSIGSIVTASNSANSVSAAFNNTVLLPGKKYTLQLNFTKVQFALSNIYWKDPAVEPDLGTGYMTFDRYESDRTTPEAIAKMKKQGVFFKTGSLIGISTGSFSSLFDPNATPIYVPDYNANDKSQNWSVTTANGKNWEWTTIPHYSDTNTDTYRTGDRYDDTLINANYNTVLNWQSYKGDICQFIDKNYRLPYSWEFGNSGTRSAAGSNGIDGSFVDGTDNRSRCVTTSDYYFPQSGFRTVDNGHMAVSNATTYYLSGSISSGINYPAIINSALSLHILGNGGLTTVTIYNTPNVNTGAVVRCIRK